MLAKDKTKEFSLLIYERENKPIVLLEKHFHKWNIKYENGVYGVVSYLKSEVEDLANNSNDSLNVTLYKYLSVFMWTSMRGCVTNREHFPKSKLLKFEESLSWVLYVNSKCKTQF